MKNILDNPKHPWQNIVIQSVFTLRLLQIRCITDHYRRSILPKAITFYNKSLKTLQSCQLQQQLVSLWGWMKYFWIKLNVYFSCFVICQVILKKTRRFPFNTFSLLFELWPNSYLYLHCIASDRMHSLCALSSNINLSAVKLFHVHGQVVSQHFYLIKLAASKFGGCSYHDQNHNAQIWGYVFKNMYLLFI